MINIRFPDNTKKKFPDGTNALEIAKNISEGLARNVLAAKIDGVIIDSTKVLPNNKELKLELLTWENDGGKSVMWHSSAHLMAEAIEFFYPNVKFAIGPPIENGFYYDMEFPENIHFSSDDFLKIENKILELAKQKNKYIISNISKQDAIKHFQEKQNPYKLELIEELNDGEITFYQQGEFVDLCKGPHMPNTGFIKAVKLINVAGAYWKGNENNKQLTRIYGITFPKKKYLDEYLIKLEEAKKRDHRKIGKNMSLFTFSNKVGQGLPLWLPKGAYLRDRLIDFMKKSQLKFGYQPVVTPHIGGKELYVCSGHYDKYGEDSFQPIKTPDQNEEFFLKPMNCPHHCEIYKSTPRSYKDLPIRFAEFGTVYRYEKSGELHGLTRVRGFTQDDAHIFTTTEELNNEILNLLTFSIKLLNCFGFDNIEADLSTRPSDSIGEDNDWENATQSLEDALNTQNISYKTAQGEGAFYGPKIDLHVKDAIGRRWQLTTIQIDFAQPDNFSLEYVNSDNKKIRPVMIHRALLGSIERFTGILTEHYAGEFPGWLAPIQVNILTIGKVDKYLEKVINKLKKYRVNIDDRNIRLGEKIHESKKLKIPVTLIIGENDSNNNTIALNFINGDENKDIELSEGIKSINKTLKKPIFKL